MMPIMAQLSVLCVVCVCTHRTECYENTAGHQVNTNTGGSWSGLLRLFLPVHKGPETGSHDLLIVADIDLKDDLKNVKMFQTEGVLQRLMCFACVWCAQHAGQHDT